MSIVQYHVYRGMITDNPLSTFEELYFGFDEESANRVYQQFKNDKLVHFEQEIITIKNIEL